MKFKIKKSELHPLLKRLLMRLHQQLLNGAAFLQQKTNQYSARKRKILLLAFCIIFVLASTLVTVCSLVKDNTAPYKVTRIRFIPLRDTLFHPVVNPAAYDRIQQFKEYVDTNKNFRDSLSRRRPGLIDTIKLLEKIYKK